MRLLLLVTSSLFSFATATASFVPGIPASLSYASAATPSDVATPPPPPTADESPGQWIDQLFDDTNSTSYNTSDFFSLDTSNVTIKPIPYAAVTQSAKERKRSYEEGNGLHESTWTNETENIAYNISVDFSKCSTGIHYSTDIGVYTFTNGTTTNSTTLKDLVADVWTLRHSTSTPNTQYASHIAVVAQLALDEANAVLNNGLICKNATQNAAVAALQPREDELIHQELRHLLANAYSYWASVVLSAGFGAAAGASLAAGLDYRFKGNVTAQNTIQTGTVVAVAIIVAGILNRMHEVGHLDNAQPLAQNVAAAAQNVVPQNIRELVPAGREAVVQQVWLGWARRALGRMRRRQIVLSEAGGSDPVQSTGVSLNNLDTGGGGGIGDSRTSIGASSQATEPGTVADLEACLDEVGAAEAAAAVGEMTSAELNLETIQEVQEHLAQRDASASCGV